MALTELDKSDLITHNISKHYFEGDLGMEERLAGVLSIIEKHFHDYHQRYNNISIRLYAGYDIKMHFNDWFYAGVISLVKSLVFNEETKRAEEVELFNKHIMDIARPGRELKLVKIFDEHGKVVEDSLYLYIKDNTNPWIEIIR